MKLLSKKFNLLVAEFSWTLEEVSASTKRNGGKIGYASLRSLSYGKGGTNPSGSRVFALAKTFKVPVRYLVDDSTHSPYEAVLADMQMLTEEERTKLLKSLTDM